MFDEPIDNALLVTHELQYAVAIAAAATFVVLLLRRRPAAGSVALYLVGALLALVGTPLLEAALSLMDRAIGHGRTQSLDADFWRTLLVGAAIVVVGVVCMGRAWRESPER